MNELHLFAGAGGGILGGMLLGHTTVCAVEIEKYPRKVLLQRQRDGILPKFPIWDDVCTFDGKPWRGKVDVVCGGFPCQDISPANKNRRGIEGGKSGLWTEMRRVVSEIQPKHVFVENSSQLVRRGLAMVAGDLEELGYDSRWCVLGADTVGLPHRRKRLWLLATNTNCESGSQENSEGCAIDAKGNTRIHNALLDWSQSPESFAQIHNPEIHGGTNGVACRVDRFKSIGNGQVPQVARLAWQILSEETEND